jgi:hypothetical protein
MPKNVSKRLYPIIVLGLAACSTPHPAVRHAEFVPPPPTKPTDRPPICAHADEVNAFKIVGVQTQMMQIALTCGADDKYDAFVRNVQPQLAAQRSILKSFFNRAYGKSLSQSEYDDYVTQLADAESNYNLNSGVDFCKLSKPVLEQATTLSSADDLARFVPKVSVQQSLNVQTCGTPGAPPETPAATSSRYHQRHYYRRHHQKTS